jgi:hypothetical protein
MTLDVYTQVLQRKDRDLYTQAFDRLMADAIPPTAAPEMATTRAAKSRECPPMGPGLPPRLLPKRFSCQMTTGPESRPQRRDPRNCEGPTDGARGTRTPDLLGAIQALSQLSYSPEVVPW